MTQKQKDIFGAFVYNQRMFLQDQIHQLQQNLRYREITFMDCIELMLAQERLNSFNEFVANVNAILKIYKY